MAVGYLATVLHAHLPYVRHPEDPTVMEEQWLYEAITGTYLPLVQLFEGMLADGVRARATVSLSAPLINMLTDDLLKERYAARLDQLIELAEKEIDRTKNEPQYQRNAKMYHNRFQALRYTWRCHDGNLVRAFRRLQDAGDLDRPHQERAAVPAQREDVPQSFPGPSLHVAMPRRQPGARVPPPAGRRRP